MPITELPSNLHKTVGSTCKPNASLMGLSIKVHHSTGTGRAKVLGVVVQCCNDVIICLTPCLRSEENPAHAGPSTNEQASFAV